MPTNTITMSTQNLRRFEVLTELSSGGINGIEASEKLALSTRHIRRLKKKVKTKGVDGLLHGNKGKVSKRAISVDIQEKITKLMLGKYKGFGPTFAAEKLEELDKITVSNEWLRLFLARNGIRVPKTKKNKVIHRSWRPRMELEGSMEQFDGSYHKWIQGLDEEFCLLLSIDDATGNLTRATLEFNEGIASVFTFWKGYAEEHGRLPKRVYVDKFSTYKVNHPHAVDDPHMVTQFDRALQAVGTELIRAHSPEAKGRVERAFGTLQDRLVKELGLAGVKTREEANSFLKTFLPKHNLQFGVKASKEGSGHVPILKTTDLEHVFSEHFDRRVANDFTIQFKNEWYQIEKEQTSTVLPRDVVIMEKRLDGSVAVRLLRTERYLSVKRLPLRPEKMRVLKIIPATIRKTVSPKASHPWRQQRFSEEKMREKLFAAV
jgi:transposase